MSVTVTSRNTDTKDTPTPCWSWYRCPKIALPVLTTQKVKLDSLEGESCHGGPWRRKWLRPPGSRTADQAREGRWAAHESVLTAT